MGWEVRGERLRPELPATVRYTLHSIDCSGDGS